MLLEPDPQHSTPIFARCDAMTRMGLFSLLKRLRIVVVPLGIFIPLGCQKAVDLPPTYPASGRVVYTDGRPMSGGMIPFVLSPPDTSIAVVGILDNNGNFTLSTIKDKTKVAGAVEGKYTVTIVPPQPAGFQSVAPIFLSGPYTAKAGENKFPDFKVAPPKSVASPR
jgi:hypothetical protein